VVSAEMGGELGEINPGDYPESFEEAAFALSEEGQFTNVVETEFGFHIIKLDEFTPSVTTPLEEVAQQIREDIILDKATNLFFTLQSDMQRLAFEIPDSLEDVAAAVDRPVFETALFTEDRYPAAVSYPQVENVAFSVELIEDQVNSDLLRLSDDRVMVVRVIEHEPQRTLALEEVKADIEETLRAEKAQQAAFMWAQELQERLYANEDVSGMLAEKSLSWNEATGVTRDQANLPRDLVNTAFTLSSEPSNNISVVSLSNGNVGLVKLNAVNPVSEISEEDLLASQQAIRGQYAQRMYQNFVDALRENAEIQIIN
jgi:peptidyl-prolyl cis-trans isomerase D